jgi:hypothetical protein
MCLTLSVVVVVVVLVVHRCATDSVPLLDDQVNALQEFYASIGCAGDEANCPNVSSVCPSLPREDFGERLSCNSGYVTAITITGERTRTTNGSLPSTIGQLSKLTSLLIYNTYLKSPIRGTLPESLFNLTLLSQLELCCGALTGTLSSRFAGLTALRVLGLHFNQFSGTIPPILSSMTSLRIVRVHNNLLTGFAPAFPSIVNPRVDCSLSVDFANTDSNCFSGCNQSDCCRSKRPACPLPPTAPPRSDQSTAIPTAAWPSTLSNLTFSAVSATVDVSVTTNAMSITLLTTQASVEEGGLGSTDVLVIIVIVVVVVLVLGSVLVALELVRRRRRSSRVVAVSGTAKGFNAYAALPPSQGTGNAPTYDVLTTEEVGNSQ